MGLDSDSTHQKISDSEAYKTEVELAMISELVDFVKRMENSSICKGLIGENSPRKKASKLPSGRLFIAAVLVALGGPFNFGYQLLITNPSQEAFIQFLNDSHHQNHNESLSREQLEGRWSFIISVFFWGCLAGAFLIRILAEKFGRKNALQISHFIQIVSCMLTIFSFYQVDAVVYSVARFLLGLGITISCGVAPMFITECSPKECRGVTSMLNGLLLQAALVVGATLAMPQLFGNGDDWWKLYATELAITTIVMILVIFIHDTPGYLHGSNDDRSERAVRFYHNTSGEELQTTLKQLDQDNIDFQRVGLFSIWKNPMARLGTLVGGVVAVSMVMSGIAAINAFSFEILLSTGLTVEQASFGNIAVCLTSVFGILFSALIVDRFGRRVLLLTTYGLLAVNNLVIAGLMYGFQRAQSNAFGYPLLAAICLFNLLFAAGPGPVALFITAELVDQNSRGAACTWVNVFMCAVRSVLVACYLPLKNFIGQPLAYFSLFFWPMVCTVILLYFFLPETKGKTAAEVQETWKSMPAPCRKRRQGSASTAASKA
nr:General substrate transporter domain containing protein [Haemonchus contortus]